MKILKNKIAVVTGAASGIGRALALTLAQRGCHLALADVNETELEQTKTAARVHSKRVTTYVVNVADRDAVYAFADEVARDHGGADLIFNNAGVTVNTAIENARYEDMQWVMDINFWGVVHGTKAFLPLLKQRLEGHIINIASINAMVPIPRNGPYNASKYAVMGFTETLAQELAGTTVHVSCVHPGGVKTNIVRDCRMADGKQCNNQKLVRDFDQLAKTTPTQAAEQIVRGVQNNDMRIFVGLDARVMSLCSRLCPELTIKLVGKITHYSQKENG